MIGSIIGGIASLAGGIFGGLSSASKMRKAEAELKGQRQKNEDWYNRRYNEDYTQTAEAQSILNQAREAAREQMQAAVGRQAVMGGTDESLQSARESGQKLISDTLKDVGVLGQQRKSAIENQYLQRGQSISDQYRQLYTGQAQQSAAAGSQMMNAGMGLVSADLSSQMNTGKGLFSTLFGSKKTSA